MNKRIAIVTGAANGIGLAISRQLSADGFFIAAIDLDEEKGNSLVSELGREKCLFLRADVSNEKEVDELFMIILKECGNIDVVVNNAGIIRDNLIWNMPVEDLDSVLNVNLKGPWLMCRAAAKVMKENKGGRIINIASRAWLGNKGQSNYSASKGGVVSLTRVLALELGKYNVLVNAVAPGLIDTPLTQKLPDHVRAKLIEAQPTRTMGSPGDVANAVGFLANERTKFITGQVIYVDGGKSVGAGI